VLHIFIEAIKTISKLDRRNFIQLSGVSLASLLVADCIRISGKRKHIMQMPDEINILIGDNYFSLQSSDQHTWKYRDVTIELKKNFDAVAVFVQSPTLPLKEVKLSWKITTQKSTIVLGDAWERTYGDVSWQSVNASKKLPWYCIEHNNEKTICFGIKTGCSTICYWQVTNNILQLTLDTRTGGNGVQLGGRTLNAAEIITTKNESNENVFATSRRFCKQMCDQPKLTQQPVYGINDWYFAYGNNSADLILQHTSLLAPLATDTSNKPFSVIDAGWAIKSPILPGDCCWSDDFSKPNNKFGDMQKLAHEIKKLGMRPGIWTRPLCAHHNDKKNLLAPSIPNRNDPKMPILDPTIEENIQRIKHIVKTYKDWNYEMVKHDYSTYDIFGRWGFEINDTMTPQGWQFNDNSKTNAEIILYLYKSIRDAAGGMYLIGCNTISHLSAGLFELNRIGDDTSGHEWERTRKMGVNTLGFRMVQHENFYEADGDCVGLTSAVPWNKNKQWMQLLAQSSAPLFISAQPEALGAEQKKFIKQCFSDAAKTQPVAEPLDWLINPFPVKWKLNGKIRDFDWS
jgi:alpha-galactosidase